MSSPWGEALDSAAAEGDDAFLGALTGFFDAVADAREEQS